MKKHFYFPFYPADFILGTVGFSTEEIGAYILLLCYQFDANALPTHSEEIARITRTSIDLKRVLRKFPDGINPKMAQIKRELEKKSIIATKSARKRWVPTQCERNANAYANAMLSKDKDKVKYKDKDKVKYKDKDTMSIITKKESKQAEFVNKWSGLYEQIAGHKYKADRKDYIIAADLINKFGYDSVLEKARLLFSACQSGGLWFAKGIGDFTISKLSYKWNEIVKKADKSDHIHNELKSMEAELKAREAKNAGK